MRTLALGIGCIWLDYATSSAYKESVHTGAKIFQDFKQALETLPSVTNVTFNPEWEGQDEWQEAEVTHGLGNNRIVPIFSNRWISFDVYIPIRLQERIADGRSCGVEHFHVDMYYDYYMPVTYVSFEKTESNRADSSLSVVIVRKLLEESLSSYSIISSCVGPSPFHCNFIVEEDKAHQSEPFIENILDRSLGYGLIRITVSSLDDPLPLALGDLGNILSSFYHLSVLRSGLIRQSAKVMSLVNSLLKPPHVRSISRLKEYIDQGNVVRDIKREVTLGRLRQLELDRFLLEADRDKSTASGTPLGRFFTEYRELGKISAWADVDYLATFSEERRQKIFANMSAVLSGILGGIIGAVFASTMTYILTTNPPEQQASLHIKEVGK